MIARLSRLEENVSNEQSIIIEDFHCWTQIRLFVQVIIAGLIAGSTAHLNYARQIDAAPDMVVTPMKKRKPMEQERRTIEPPPTLF